MISGVLGGHVLLWSLLDSPKNVSPALLLHCNPTHSQIWTISQVSLAVSDRLEAG